MKLQLNSNTAKYLLVSAALFGLLMLVHPQAQAQTYSVLYNFSGGSDGGQPFAGLVIDTNGNLYGTTTIGGTLGLGAVVKVTGGGQESVLYNFAGGNDGADPEAILLMDTKGNLYGTTYNGGGSANCTSGCGTIFEVDPAGNETVLYRFNGSDGANPEAGLIMDRLGNLYGTTFNGGADGFGTVFELNKDGNESVLYSFTGAADGANPVAGLTFDREGRLYGTTSLGGDMTCQNPNNTYGCGTVFQLANVSPTPKGPSSWKESVLYSFTLQSDGGIPWAGLTFDKSGHLYGATTDGGSGGSNGGGTIFEMVFSKNGWTFNVIYSLQGWGISGSYRNLFLDAAGNIWDTTHCDGTLEDGTIYELSPSEGSWTYTLLYSFCSQPSCTDGMYPHSNLVADKNGNFYGTAYYGGTYLYDGVVFKITP